jgi:glycosyltransferase involved in cell wall biosynthesis
MATGRIARGILYPFLRSRCDVAIGMNGDTAFAMRKFPVVAVRPNVILEYGRSLQHSRPSNAPAADKVVLFAGRLLEWKGVMLLIEAMGHLDSTYVLRIVGDGPDRDRAVEAAGKTNARIEFVGRVAHSQMASEFRRAHVLALPSLHDSAGWVAAEAASSGLPVVCLDLGGVRRVAGSSAVVVPAAPGRSLPSRLGDAIERAVAMEPDREEPWTMAGSVEWLRGLYAAATCV